MSIHEVSRTLVKSQPELWAELSEPTSLARHLDQFGEIKITRLEPETTVAWEGERVSGTVRLEPSGWGTRVTLQAAPAVEQPPPAPAILEVALLSEVPPAPEPDPPPEPQPDPTPEPLPPAAGSGDARRPRWVGRVIRFFRAVPESTVVLAPVDPTSDVRSEEAAAAATPDAGEAQPPQTPDPMTEVLAAALDSLGQAHHRPFSRA